jgi:hypothetical protein
MKRIAFLLALVVETCLTMDGDHVVHLGIDKQEWDKIKVRQRRASAHCFYTQLMDEPSENMESFVRDIFITRIFQKRIIKDDFYLYQDVKGIFSSLSKKIIKLDQIIKEQISEVSMALSSKEKMYDFLRTYANASITNDDIEDVCACIFEESLPILD